MNEKNNKMERAKEQQIKKLQQFGQRLSVSSQKITELSVYDDQLTIEGLTKAVSTVKFAFPALPSEFHVMLADRIKANKFTDERLKDAINNVIDTCVYPTPTIANFISYDRKIKLYTRSQFIKLNDEYGGRANEYYAAVDIGKGTPYYASKEHISEFNLVKWIPKQNPALTPNKR